MQYNINDSNQVAKQASQDIEVWLRSLPQTSAVVNVEHDPAYWKRDIDLILTTDKGVFNLEVKGDRWHKSGNFFFETHSNQERGTPGCFLYTEADWICYYFVTTRILYLLPMPETRDWFLACQNGRFQEKTTTTKVRDTFYTTVGRLVPIKIAKSEVAGRKIRKLKL